MHPSHILCTVFQSRYLLGIIICSRKDVIGDLDSKDSNNDDSQFQTILSHHLGLLKDAKLNGKNIYSIENILSSSTFIIVSLMITNGSHY